MGLIGGSNESQREGSGWRSGFRRLPGKCRVSELAWAIALSDHRATLRRVQVSEKPAGLVGST
jgi:hypothetical protein